MLRMSLAAFVAVGLLAAPALTAADETYTIKFYQTKKGDKSSHDKVEDTKTNIIVKIPGMNKDEVIPSAEKESYTEEVIEKKPGDKRATKLKRTYTVAEKTEKGETNKAIYTGKTVIIEKKGKEYEITLDGKKLTKDDAPELFKEFSEKKDDQPKDEDFLPDHAVKVGESWKIPAEKSEKLFKTLDDDKMKVDAKKSTIEGKLLKVYKQGGAQFGTIEITVTAIITEVDIAEQLVKTVPGSKMVVKATIDTCIDGTVRYESGKVLVTLDISVEIPDTGTLTFKSTTNGTEKVTAK
jgi:hypothetical protein